MYDMALILLVCSCLAAEKVGENSATFSSYCFCCCCCCCCWWWWWWWWWWQRCLCNYI